MARKIEISHKTIIFAVGLLIGLWFIYFIRDILLQVFVGLFIMVILNPTVKKLSKFKIPRALSVLVVYLSSVALISWSAWSVFPALVEQTAHFISGLPAYLDQLGLPLDVTQQITAEAVSQAASLPSEAVRVTVSVFSNLVTILSVLIFGFYLLITRDKLDQHLSYLVGKEKSAEIEHILDELELKLGGWARGQLSLMLLVGGSTYIGLLLLGIPYAIPLAIFAGLLEAVPYVGPIFAAVPTVIIGFGISPVMGFATIALAFLIQQLENYVFVPKVMEKSVGISPVITLVALSIGFRVAGVVGVILSVPMVIFIRVLSQHFLHK